MQSVKLTDPTIEYIYMLLHNGKQGSRQSFAYHSYLRFHGFCLLSVELDFTFLIEKKEKHKWHSPMHTHIYVCMYVSLNWTREEVANRSDSLHEGN